MAKFKEGDIVQLKSGGPTMTVCSGGSSGSHYQCKWFSGKKLEEGYFPDEALIVPPTNKDETRKK